MPARKTILLPCICKNNGFSDMSRLNGHDAPNHFFVAKWFCVVWAFAMLARVHEDVMLSNDDALERCGASSLAVISTRIPRRHKALSQ